MTTALFPGSFDPITNGHLDIIKRASAMFDKVVVVVGINNQKRGWLSIEDRVTLIKTAVELLPNVSVMATDGLIVDLASQLNATVLIRGVRNAMDFDAEKSLATFNRQLNSNVETVLLPTLPEFESLSSTRVRELYKFNIPLAPYVPQSVAKFLKQKRDFNEE
ncbi:pantetheine-phosphate adenylyltransferase [Nicoliella lavandulae]|uniref:Phosphopantetheine adenylyltransferase n=1 Tax=Nicoliella lavandulae TaxID=3082954 RepID=A0ABU8SLX0_9LACO